MRALDLFCCCGGAGMGLKLAGFSVTGVDITPDHVYPSSLNFVNADVFSLPLEYFDNFDFIWASPPCQHYTWGTRKNRHERFPDLVQRTRELLQKTGKPFVIENVVGAPLRKDLVLCGEMFSLRVIRHRIFEIHGFSIEQIKHKKHHPPLDKTHSWYCCVAGHGGDSFSFSLNEWQKAMGIYWISDKKHLAQAVPPAYSKYIASSYLCNEKDKANSSKQLLLEKWLRV